MSDLVEPLDGWLLVKRNLYWRPNSSGYTGVKRHAGRYSLDEARALESDEVMRIHENEAPDFTASCYSDIKEKEQSARITALEQENARLREALKPFADEAKEYVHDEQDSDTAWSSYPTVGDLRKAATALWKP